MGGPSVTRLNPAGQPSLTQPGLGLLGQIFPGAGQQSSNPFAYGTSPISQAFGKIGGPLGSPPQMAGGNDVMTRIQQVFGTPGGQFGGQAAQGFENILNQSPQQYLSAYQPIFQRNLALAQDTGARFSSGNDLLRSNALADYNMFAQQALQQQHQQQLQAAAGLSQLGQSQNPLLMQLLGTLFKGGGIDSGPIYNVQPGLGQQLLGMAGSLGGAALGGGLFGGGGAGAPPGGTTAGGGNYPGSPAWFGG